MGIAQYESYLFTVFYKTNLDHNLDTQKPLIIIKGFMFTQ